MITIDLRQSMTVRVPDASGTEQTYDLVAGLNDVPREVAEHWYVSKFTQPVRRVPRTVVPSAARPMDLPPAALATMAEALAPVAAAPEPSQTADVPAAKEPKAKA